MNAALDPHCKIGRIRLKGARNITTRLPKKFTETTLALMSAARTRASIGEGRRS